MIIPGASAPQAARQSLYCKHARVRGGPQAGTPDFCVARAVRAHCHAKPIILPKHHHRKRRWYRSSSASSKKFKLRESSSHLGRGRSRTITAPLPDHIPHTPHHIPDHISKPTTRGNTCLLRAARDQRAGRRSSSSPDSPSSLGGPGGASLRLRSSQLGYCDHLAPSVGPAPGRPALPASTLEIHALGGARQRPRTPCSPTRRRPPAAGRGCPSWPASMRPSYLSRQGRRWPAQLRPRAPAGREHVLADRLIDGAARAAGAPVQSIGAAHPAARLPHVDSPPTLTSLPPRPPAQGPSSSSRAGLTPRQQPAPRQAPLPQSSRQLEGEASAGSRGAPTSRAAAAVSPILNRISRRAAADDGTLTSLMGKFRAVFNIFFPERPRPLTPKEQGRQRLQMILVADRCGLSPAALIEMKRNTFKALQVRGGRVGAGGREGGREGGRGWGFTGWGEVGRQAGGAQPPCRPCARPDAARPARRPRTRARRQALHIHTPCSATRATTHHPP
jgi:hypothetical protein